MYNPIIAPSLDENQCGKVNTTSHTRFNESTQSFKASQRILERVYKLWDKV